MFHKRLLFLCGSYISRSEHEIKQLSLSIVFFIELSYLVVLGFGILILKKVCLMRKNLLVLLLFSPISLGAWTELYKKKLASSHGAVEQKRGPVLWQQVTKKPFNQLIFSWNSKRPAKDHFVFEVRVRNAQTHTWYPWHEAVHWGKKVQKTFHTGGKNGTSYVYVRLELPKGERADAFSLRVTSTNNASLKLLRHLAVSVSDFSLFAAESVADYQQGYSSLILSGVPQYCQMVLDHKRADTMCSPTSTAMMSAYLAKEELDPLSFAHQVYDTGFDVYGNWLFNVAHAYEASKGKSLFYVARLASFRELYQFLKKKIPVVVSVRGSLPGAPRPSYPSGHLIIIIGYDAAAQKVICHDPAAATNADVLRSYPLADFLVAWEKSHRLAYCAEPVCLKKERV
jgi:hypothetical protein